MCVRLATIRGGGVWSKPGIQGTFWPCLKRLSGLKSKLLSSFLKVVGPHDQPVRGAVDYSESYFSNPISDGDFRGRKMEANIRMEEGVARGGIGRV